MESFDEKDIELLLLLLKSECLQGSGRGREGDIGYIYMLLFRVSTTTLTSGGTYLFEE